MIKKFLIICLIFIALTGAVIWFCFYKRTPIKNLDYYYKDNNTTICFPHLDNCCSAEPTQISFIKNKTFIGLGIGEQLYDTSTYKYDKKTDEYTVDMLLDRDFSTDLGYYSKCPYDDGIITHVLFGITYIPSKKVFKAEYKGFLSSKEIITYDSYGNPSTYYLKHLNLYYTKDKHFIGELDDTLKYLNEEVIKSFNPPNNCNYGVDIIYLLKNYI